MCLIYCDPKNNLILIATTIFLNIFSQEKASRYFLRKVNIFLKKYFAKFCFLKKSPIRYLFGKKKLLFSIL